MDSTICAYCRALREALLSCQTQGAAEQEVSLLLKRAMTAAKKVLAANEALLERIGATLEVEEKLSGEPLAALLRDVKGAPELRDFVNGR